jgi:hypothetical protein
MTTKKTTKTKKVEKPVEQSDTDTTVSLKKGLIKVSMTMTDGVLKMENTADQVVKSVGDVKDFINLLVDAVSLINKMAPKYTCCSETDNEEVCVGPCYCSQN